MTAKKLYKVSDTFRSLIEAWEIDRRCPFAMVDFLLENDLPVQAEAARWAATEEDRPVFVPLVDHGERGGECGPYPIALCREKTLQWVWTEHVGTRKIGAASDLPDGTDIEQIYRTIREAILALLDNWKLPQPENTRGRTKARQAQ